MKFAGLCSICQAELDQDRSCSECAAVKVADEALTDYDFMVPFPDDIEDSIEQETF